MWHFDEEALAAIARFYGGEPAGIWRDGLWHANRREDNFSMFLRPQADRIEVLLGVFQQETQKEKVDMACNDADAALKLMLVMAGADYRYREGMDTLLLPGKREMAGSEIAITRMKDSFNGAELAWNEGGVSKWASFSFAPYAVRFTLYGLASFDEIIESMESPMGAPLFAHVPREPARRR